jgi:hypothetical protein
MDELEKMLADAEERGRLVAEIGPHAVSAQYDRTNREVVVELANGATFTFPVDRVEGLSGASDNDLAHIELTPAGHGLHWETLDEDYTVPGLLMGIFGTRAWMRAHRSAA